MTNITLAPPIVGGKNTSEEPKVGTAIKTLEEFLNQTVPGTGIGTGNIIKESVTEEKLSAAVQILLNKAAAGLTVVKQAGSTTGESGNLYLMETNATTLTLPAATSGRMVGVATKNAIAESKMKAGVGKIFGDFLSPTGVETVTLAENQHMIVEADGTNWRILSGEGKRTQAYGARTERAVTTEFEPSSTRPTQVSFEVNGAPVEAFAGTLSIGGVVVQQFEVKGPTAVSLGTYQIWPGVKYSWAKTAGTFKVFTTYLQL